ncbi:hypothetical protein [Methylorubrum extorquens]|uniref:hypothetical protein n=1 Tax=Methylorubrum extorquens TaxID=408 RepID=UPI001300EF0B|nr:hypothetical protein [Methylorubrum extorquens]
MERRDPRLHQVGLRQRLVPELLVRRALPGVQVGLGEALPGLLDAGLLQHLHAEPRQQPLQRQGQPGLLDHGLV